MTAVSKAFYVITFAVIFPDVTSWIVDMAEVEKMLGKDQLDEVLNYDEENLPDVSSEADNEVTYTANYAENFSYQQTFKRKELRDEIAINGLVDIEEFFTSLDFKFQIDNVIKDGGVYLEELSNAMAAYRNTLDDCSRNSSKISATADKPNKEDLARCEKAEKKKQYVQKLSEMAILTSDKLRDNAYDKINEDEDDDEEAELIKLAWTLDRLTYLTGNGSVQGGRGLTPSNNIQDQSHGLTTEAVENVTTTEDNKQLNLEILEQVENGRPLQHLPPTPALTDVKSTLTDVKSVQKRDTGDIMRYYLKYKVWNGSNSIDDHQRNDYEEFDVDNSFKVLPIRKRSLADKKAANMQNVLQKIRRLRCKPKDHSKASVRKLVKSIKVYRRKILKNNINGH